MDVSKFFYGGYVLEHSSKMKPLTHSNIARGIVNGIAVARLNEKSMTFSANIADSDEVNKTTSSFVLKPIGSECKFIAPSSTDYNAFGRHFLVRSFSMLNVRRHYTLCQSLKKDVYAELLKAIENSKAGKEVKFNNSLLPES